jgi:hypothetical protein
MSYRDRRSSEAGRLAGRDATDKVGAPLHGADHECPGRAGAIQGFLLPADLFRGADMSLSIDASLKSLNDSFDQYSRVAQRVASNGAGDDLANNLVELIQIRAQVKANVISIKTEEDLLGTLIDTFA